MIGVTTTGNIKNPAIVPTSSNNNNKFIKQQSRESLLADVVKAGILDCAYPQVRQLFHALERVSAASKIKNTCCIICSKYRSTFKDKCSF